MRRLIATTAAAVALAMTAGPVLAQDGSLTITNLLCPTGYTGTSYAADCTEPPDPPIDFVVDGPTSETATPDTNGVVTFSGLAAGTYTVTGGVPGEFASAVVECEATSGDATTSLDGVILTLELGEDAVVECDWFNVPEDLSGLPPTDLPAPASSPVTILGLVLVGLAGVLITVRRGSRRAEA